MLENILYYLSEILIVVSVSILIMHLLGPFIAKKYGVKWRKWIWLVLAIRLLIPYNFTISMTPIHLFNNTKVIKQVPRAMEVNQTPFTNPVVNNSASIINSVNNTHKEETFKSTIDKKQSLFQKFIGTSIQVKIVLIWSLGAIVVISLHYILYFIFRRNCKTKSERIKDIDTLEIIKEIRKKCRVKKDIPAYYCELINSPMIMGSFNTMLLIPRHKYEEDEFKFILKHEFIHYRSRDLWYKAFMTLICDIYWFNPILLIMKRQAFKDLELVCDKNVVEGMNKEERAVYSNALLFAGKRGGREILYSTCFTGNKKIIKERIERVFDMSKKKSGRKFLIFVIAIFVVGSLFVACGTKDKAIVKNIDKKETIQEPTNKKETTTKTTNEQTSEKITQETAKETTNQVITQNLSQEELDFFANYFNDGSNYGFLLSNYDNPTQIDLKQVFYNGAGLDATDVKLSGDERSSFLKSSQSDDIYTDVTKLTSSQINDFLQQKAGVSFSEITSEFKWIYLKDYDAYYFEHGDTNWKRFSCVSGTKTSDGTFVINCKDVSPNTDAYKNTCTVTLKKVGDSYKFQSNTITGGYNKK